MMEPCPITKSICPLQPEGPDARRCSSCPDFTRFLNHTGIPATILSRKDYLLPMLRHEAYKNALEGSFLERCYKAVIKDLKEVL